MLTEPFILRALLAGISVALAAGPLGSFMIWRRMVYFGDALSHAALLGAALSLFLSLPIILGVGFISLLIALYVTALKSDKLHSDIALGVAAHSALAMGLVAFSLAPSNSINIDNLLFGDILSISWLDVALIGAGAIAVILFIASRWRALLLSSLSSDLAIARNINPKHEEIYLAICLALFVTLSIKLVGALLVTAMLLIPASAARIISKSPEHMVMVAMAIGIGSAFLGLELSIYFDTPTGPTIILCSVAAFAILSIAQIIKRR